MSKNEDDTEFNFSDVEDTTATPPPPRISPSIISRGDSMGGRRGFASGLFSNGGKRKLLLLSIGLVVAVLAIFKILEWVLTPSKKTPQVQPPAQVAQITPVQPMKEQQIPAKEQPIQASENKPIDLMTEGRIQAQNSQVEKLQQKVARLEMTLDDVQTQLAMMSQLVQSMSQQLQQQTVAKTSKPTEPEKKKKTSLAASPVKAVEMPVYYIQALVPGRAWLANQKGGVTTVGLGDEIPGYGVVTVIDVEQGMVSTDKGQTMRYHPDDR